MMCLFQLVKFMIWFLHDQQFVPCMRLTHIEHLQPSSRSQSLFPPITLIQLVACYLLLVQLVPFLSSH